MIFKVSSLLTIFAAQSAFAQFGGETPKFNPNDPAAPHEDRRTAEVVAEVTSEAPEKPFLAAVKLTHAPLHHTYGKVLPPDVIGRPTSVT